jgi:hypothetical protein
MKATGIEYRLRDRGEILAEYQSVVSYEQRAHAEEFRQFLAGARSALAWVLGRTKTAPASGRVEPATVERMQREERLSDRVIYATEVRPTLDPDFANGVEHALSWARGAEDLPPTPLELSAPAPRRPCACG